MAKYEYRIFAGEFMESSGEVYANSMREAEDRILSLSRPGGCDLLAIREVSEFSEWVLSDPPTLKEAV